MARLGFEGVEEISAEIARLAPAYRGVDAEVVGSPARRDGIVVPIEATTVTITSRPRPIDPIATPGILSTEEQGAPLSVGFGLPRLSTDGPTDPEARQQTMTCAEAPQLLPPSRPERRK